MNEKIIPNFNDKAFEEIIKPNNTQNKEKNEIIKPKEEKIELMSQINFKENPQNLKFKY